MPADLATKRDEVSLFSPDEVEKMDAMSADLATERDKVSLFSPDEVEKIDAMSADLATEREAIGAVGACLFRPTRLFRFLDANEGVFEDAVAQFREMLHVQEEAGIPELRKEVEGKPWAPESLPSGSEKLFRLIKADMWGFTPDGDMLMVQCDGQAQLDEISKIPDEDIFSAFYFMMELRQDHLDRLSEESQKVCKVFQIRDLSGLSLIKVTGNAFILNRMKAIMETSRTVYPENVRKVVLLNAPTGFDMLWSLLKPVMSQRMQNKVLFLSTAKIGELVALAGPKTLEVLSNLRGDLAHPGLDGADIFVDIVAGDAAYALVRLAQGSSAEWSFFVGPEELDIDFSAVFFPDASCESATADPAVASSVCAHDLERVTGAVSGSFHAEASGVLWVTWSNEHSWFRGKRIEGIHGLEIF